MSDLYLSTAIDKGYDIIERVKLLNNMGVENIELSGGGTFKAKLETKLKKIHDKKNIEFLVHNYFPPPKSNFVLNLASSHEKVRKRSVSFCKRSIKMSADIGQSLYTLHPGYRVHFEHEESEHSFKKADNLATYEESFSKFLKSLDVLTSYAEKQEVTIGLENLFPSEGLPDESLFTRPDEWGNILKKYKKSTVGILLDLAHLDISAKVHQFDKLKALKRLNSTYSERIVGVHISKNEKTRDTHKAVPMDSWMIEFLKKKNGLPVTLEMRSESITEVLSCYKRLKKEIFE